MTSIASHCMIANLQIGVWTGHRLDKKATAQVIADADAEGDAARVNKHLIGKDKLKAITTAQGKIRLYFYDKTSPWKDNGDRILTRVMYPRFIDEFGVMVSEFDGAVADFLKNVYPAEVARAEFRMGSMFDAKDYPTPRELKSRFFVNLDIDAVSEANDFRVNLGKDTVAGIRKEIEDATERRLVAAQAHVWGRLAKTVDHFRERMKADVFKDATIENLAELAEILPGLNVTNDPEINRLAKDIKSSLLGHTPKDLRGDDKLRKSLGKEAKRIMTDIGGFMKAFEGSK